LSFLLYKVYDDNWLHQVHVTCDWKNNSENISKKIIAGNTTQKKSAAHLLKYPNQTNYFGSISFLKILKIEPNRTDWEFINSNTGFTKN
jgi:hypothetical protein